MPTDIGHKPRDNNLFYQCTGKNADQASPFVNKLVDTPFGLCYNVGV